MTTSTLSLSDLSQLTGDYLRQEVGVRIGVITGNVQKGEEGTFTVRITNSTDARGIRLHDGTVHLEVVVDAVVGLDPFVGTLYETRATGSRSDPRLPLGDAVEEMYVFFPQASAGLELSDVIEPGEVVEFQVTYLGEKVGTTDVTAHVHASFAVDDLFPRTRGVDAAGSITIERP
jgi:hypothetical protein